MWKLDMKLSHCCNIFFIGYISYSAYIFTGKIVLRTFWTTDDYLLRTTLSAEDMYIASSFKNLFQVSLAYQIQEFGCEKMDKWNKNIG